MATIKNSVTTLALLGMLAAFTAMAAGDDYDAAVKAYASGEYKKAYQLFLPLAQSGDEDAQFHLGLMYDNGLGVKQDATIAEQWYNRACPLPPLGESTSQQ